MLGEAEPAPAGPAEFAEFVAGTQARMVRLAELLTGDRGRAEDLTPRAARVTVTFFGREFSAGVAPVPLGGGATIGAYLIWLRLPPGVTGYGSGDTGPVVAYDAGGRVIARHGPGL